jgi:hypothetical protein
MRKQIIPYFGGLWAVHGDPLDDRRLRTAIQFFGETQMVVLDFEKPNQIIHAAYAYTLEERTISMLEIDSESKEEKPIIEMKWRLHDNGLLEFAQGKRVTLWEATTVDQLVSEGYPRRLFDSLRAAYLESGFFYLDGCLVPDRSVFAAAKK